MQTEEGRVSSRLEVPARLCCIPRRMTGVVCFVAEQLVVAFAALFFSKCAGAQSSCFTTLKWCMMAQVFFHFRVFRIPCKPNCDCLQGMDGFGGAFGVDPGSSGASSKIYAIASAKEGNSSDGVQPRPLEAGSACPPAADEPREQELAAAANIPCWPPFCSSSVACPVHDHQTLWVISLREVAGHG